jgi:hypothetical protein
MSSSQLTFTPWCFRGVGLNHRPELYYPVDIGDSHKPWAGMGRIGCWTLPDWMRIDIAQSMIVVKLLWIPKIGCIKHFHLRWLSENGYGGIEHRRGNHLVKGSLVHLNLVSSGIFVNQVKFYVLQGIVGRWFSPQCRAGGVFSDSCVPWIFHVFYGLWKIVTCDPGPLLFIAFFMVSWIASCCTDLSLVILEWAQKSPQASGF